MGNARAAVQQAARLAHRTVTKALGVTVTYKPSGQQSPYDPATGTLTEGAGLALTVAPLDIGTYERTQDARIGAGALRFEVNKLDWAAVRAGPPQSGEKIVTADGATFQVAFWTEDAAGIAWTITCNAATASDPG